MRVYIFGIILLCNTLAACKSGSVDLALGTPNIVAKAMEFHGNEMFQSAALSMTITSLSGSFRIESSRENGRFEYIVTDPRSQRLSLIHI